MNKRVISYCMYYGGSADSILSADTFTRYLTGLSENISLRDKYFPGWEIYLYLEDWLAADISVQSVISAASDLKVIPFSASAYDKIHHAAFERFRVLWDKEVHISIVRDVDQLLTPEDARLVNEWCSKPQKFLIYRWEHMTLTAMGGGFAFKRSKTGELIDSTPYYDFIKTAGVKGIDYSGRAFDEQCIAILSDILRFGPMHGGRRSREIITTYCNRTLRWRRKSNKRLLIRPNNYMVNKPIMLRRPVRLLMNTDKPRDAYMQYLYDIAIHRTKVKHAGLKA